jgi:ribose transport system ATP-binding protein
MAQEEILAMHGVEKSFPGVKALDGIVFSVFRGEVHALIGHNGAGKSTLIKILGGVYTPDAGTITLRGQSFVPQNPLKAALSGISIIHQEFNLIPDLTVAQNIFLGREPKTKWGFLDDRAMKAGAAEVLGQLKVQDVSPSDYVRELSVNQLQLVEIAKALSVRADIIVMDEPTAALPLPDVKKLFETVSELRNNGVTIIYISHRLEEIFEICDRATLMKDGRMLDTVSLGQTDRQQLVEKMCGRAISDFFPAHPETPPDRPALLIEDLKSPAMSKPVSFRVHAGEIYGVTGLEGCGSSATVRALFGQDHKTQGRVTLGDEKIDIHSPLGALQAGFGFVTKDRRREGLVLTSGLDENMAIPLRVRERKAGWLDRKNERALAVKMRDRLDIKTADLSTEAQFLSGGNQQKVVLAKWLLTRCRVLIVDEPTRGVDVESKTEIYNLLRELVEQGVFVIVVSSDMEEVLGVCDRILVMHRGEITGLFDWKRASEQAVMLAATGCAVDGDGHPLDDGQTVCAV